MSDEYFNDFIPYLEIKHMILGGGQKYVGLSNGFTFYCYRNNEKEFPELTEVTKCRKCVDGLLDTGNDMVKKICDLCNGEGIL